MTSKVLSYGAGSEVTPLYKLAISDPSQKFRSLHLSHRRRLTISAARGTPRLQYSEPNDAASPVLMKSVVDAHNPRPKETEFFSSTGTVPLPPPVSMKQWSLTDQHLILLSTIACVTGGAVTALFVAAIPTLLAFKRAAESLEKLLEVTREELPGTMAAVRLSGMEISDLTMELSELGQEISSGVKNSARAVRAAQDGLRRVSSIASMAFLQEHTAVRVGLMKPTVAGAARGLHERLTEMRMIFQSVVTLRYLVGWVGKFWSMRRRQFPESTSIRYSLNSQHAKENL